ncbi:GLPGLI family protein [Empedobacter falsenii]|uniref:GLPGLI family protein n=1 Tax=Empedobacter falsenii TaxID=343874 RepID=UPI002574FE59|nr:GLPGLI family protein [Empedobacter falsenii]MDM1298167.1 GLPGLI family protein [Empedobacter falsenii]MDM1317758.1 GLPGLI family protein [Empedobacter falsenii]
MKYLVIFISFFCSLVQAQEALEIEYEEVSIPRIIGKDGKEESLSSEVVKAFAVPKNYLLQINKGESVFTQIERVNNEQGLESVIILGVIGYNVSLDFNQNKMKQEWLIEHKKYLVIDTISTHYKYELTQEKSTYLGFDVKQAIVRYGDDNKTIIWYAPSLPKRFGPKEFINLPGLVLKVEGYQNGKIDPTYYLKATSVTTKDHLEFKKLFKAKEISKAEFEKLKADYDKQSSNENQGVDKD